MKIYLSHASSYDFENELYRPLKENVSQEYEIFFPHDPENAEKKTKQAIANSDLLLAEVSSPSTGQGIEIGWAEAKGIPVVCFYRSGSNTSSSLKFVTDTFIEYHDQSDMVYKLKDWLEAK